MTPAARLRTAQELLHTIRDAQQPADAILHRFFKTNRFVGSKDRQTLQTWVFGFYRHLTSTLAVAQSLNIPDDNLQLLLYVFLIRHGFFDSASLVRLCNGSTYHPAPLTSEEAALCDQVQQVDAAVLTAEAQSEVPPHWLPLFKATFQDAWVAAAQALNQQATVDLRINTLKTPLESARLKIRKDFPLATPTPYAPTGMRLASRVSLSAYPGYAGGWVEIQDEGSQLVAFLVDPKPGMNVLDYCAGAGGKTLALGALMENKGMMVALDPVPARIKRAQERLRRAGVFNTQCRTFDPATLKWLERQKGRFDRVLLDVPCSGSGTWRRNPDLKWRMTPKDLEELVLKQASLLASVDSLLKVGGRLIYATCSVFPDENQYQIDHFLRQHTHFKLLNAPEILQEQGIPYQANEPFLSLNPHTHDTDGFFAAVLVKEGATGSSNPHQS